MPDNVYSNKLPAYKRVYSDLKLSLKSAKYTVGSFLPTEAELEKLYGVSRTTIRHAMALLVQDGVVRVTQGRGTEVLVNGIYEKYSNVNSISSVYFNPLEERSQPLFKTSQINISLVAAREKTASILGVDPNSQLYCLQRVLSVDNNIPVALVVDYLPPKLVPNFETYAGKFTDLYTFLDETYAVKYLNSTETISAKSASLLEANTLNVEVGSPLLYCQRTAYCDKGPMEYAYSTYVPDLYKITINMDVHDYALV